MYMKTLLGAYSYTLRRSVVLTRNSQGVIATVQNMYLMLQLFYFQHILSNFRDKL